MAGTETLENCADEAKACALEARIDRGLVPAHVAMIMDGNGRWANGIGADRLAGHAEGYRNLARVLRWCDALGVKYLTVYAFSSENWRRPQSEIEGLMGLIEAAARFELDGLIANNVQVRNFGRKDGLPSSLQAALDELEKSTSTNTGLTFGLAINYGGQAEIVDAARRCVEDGLRPEDVDEAAIAARLYQPDVPDVDLMVRTAGELRWSNFMIWRAAYAELYVTEKTWPEFDCNELVQAVAAYQARTRKFGGLSDNA